MRISDWSSDVCSSDLAAARHGAQRQPLVARLRAEGGEFGGKRRDVFPVGIAQDWDEESQRSVDRDADMAIFLEHQRLAVVGQRRVEMRKLRHHLRDRKSVV